MEMMTQEQHRTQIDRVFAAIAKNLSTPPIVRLVYPGFTIDEQLEFIKAIAKRRIPNFTIDAENRFTYVNFLKWLTGDTSMQAIDPNTGEITTGRLNRGIYIAGNTGSGKTACLDLMLEYSRLMGYKIKVRGVDMPLTWRNYRADVISEQFVATGSISDLRNQRFLGIQDLGTDADVAMYMGNRMDVCRNIIENRGDRDDAITFITSNLRLRGTPMVDRYGERVQSRLTEMCNYFEIKGKDRRNP